MQWIKQERQSQKSGISPTVEVSFCTLMCYSFEFQTEKSTTLFNLLNDLYVNSQNSNIMGLIKISNWWILKSGISAIIAQSFKYHIFPEKNSKYYAWISLFQRNKSYKKILCRIDTHFKILIRSHGRHRCIVVEGWGSLSVAAYRRMAEQRRVRGTSITLWQDFTVSS